MSGYTIGQVRKALVNLLGLATMLVSGELVHGTALLWTRVGIVVVTAVIHFLTPNDDPVQVPPQHRAE